MEMLILKALGGLGLFLVGMRVMTDGLRALAGNALRRLLRRSTRSPLSGVLTGAASTAMVQSSSATTIAVVGFVGAGLMSFHQALGIIFGANIGTTVTGWMVAILGFKLQIGAVLTPFVLIGVMIAMFASGRWKHVGWAVTGFALLFVGISTMQEGLAFLNTIVTPSDFPADTLSGRLQLVAIGLVITLITQSSSAGVAAALAALSTGAITFPQAAAMVIGMDVGTTFTAALATLGGSVGSRRTGYAHVIYNVLTGALAFALLTPLTQLIDVFLGITDPQIALVAFHTSFNVLGVVAIIGFTSQFERLVVWLVPERGPVLTARLDDRLLSDAAAAIDAAAATSRQMGDALFSVVVDQLAGGEPRSIEQRLASVAVAQDETSRFVEDIRSDPTSPTVHQRHLALFHALDHQARLYQRCGQKQRIDAIAGDDVLRGLADQLRHEVTAILEHEDDEKCEKRIDVLRRLLREEHRTYRDEAIAQASLGDIEISDVTLKLDAVRWLHRVTYHIWRILYHQLRAESDAPPRLRNIEPAIEAEEE